MKTAFFIARRYLFSKKKHHAINIISVISMLGVTVGCMALVCTLSVFNGFSELVESFFTDFDSDLRITLRDGGNFRADAEELVRLKALDDVAVATGVMQGYALAVRDGRQEVVTLKGVEENFLEQKAKANLFYGNDTPMLKADVLEFGILGIGLCSHLGMDIYFDEPLKLYAPKKGERINMANPMVSFNHDELYSPGAVFMVHQEKYDAHYVLSSLGFAQRLLDSEGMLSAMEITLAEGGSRRNVEAVLGNQYKVSDRYEQQEDVFRVMKIEKLIAFIFLSFILFVASLNIVGSLSMLMADKKSDIATLRSMGASRKMIQTIFCIEGAMIVGGGTIIGTAIGLVLCYVQKTCEIIRMGSGEGRYLVDAYPVSVHLSDVVMVLTIVAVMGIISVGFTVRRASRQ